MTCERWRSALTESALGAPPTPEFLGHLETCSICGARLAKLKGLVGRIDEEIKAGLDVAGGAAFRARVRQRAAERKKRPRPWFTGWLLPAAAVAFALVLIVLVRRHPEPPTESVHVSPSVPPPARGALRDEPSPPSVAAAPSPAPREEPPPRTATVGPARAQPVPPAPPSEPEVFLRPGEADRIRALAESLRSRPVKAASLLAVGFDPGEPEDRTLKPLPEPKRDVAGGLERPLRPIQIESLQVTRSESRPLTIEPGGLAAGRETQAKE